jgi:hypothetical protein
MTFDNYCEAKIITSSSSTSSGTTTSTTSDATTSKLNDLFIKFFSTPYCIIQPLTQQLQARPAVSNCKIYYILFYLAFILAVTFNACILTGMRSVAHCAPCSPFAFYYKFTYNYTAISSVTRIAYAYLIQTRYFALGNVSVRDLVAANTELILNGGFETGDLKSWRYCNQFNASSTGGVKSNFSYTGFTYYPQSGTYYYLGGSNISADYIIQSFPTTVGHTYSVSMSSMYIGDGSATSTDLFLGI